MKLTFVIIGVSLSVLGCSSIKSIESPASDSSDGLMYYMPKKDFLVTIVKNGGKITTVSLGTTGAYPDTSKSYVLKYDQNLLGKNTLNVGADINGLLKSSKSTTVSGVSDVLKNLGETLGTLTALGAEAVAPPDDCPADGTHTFTIAGETTKDKSLCGLKITVTKLATTQSAPLSQTAGVSYSGVFYRQAEPYRMVATGSLNTSAIVFSPSSAPVHFLPVSKTLFSNNEADFDFTDGMPTKYNQDTDGELVALSKLPATILSAYFSAIGTVFDSFKERDTKQADALNAQLKLELAKKKYDACVVAIQAKDNTAIQQLDCGK
jgi:hypothetical protein